MMPITREEHDGQRLTAVQFELAVRRAAQGVRELRLLAVDRDVDSNAVNLVRAPLPVR